MRYLTMYLALILSFLCSAETAIERIEPPFWWTGMKHTELQILVYGTNIGDLEPSLSHPGIELQHITRLANSNYLFLDILIADHAKPGTFELTFQRQSHHIFSYEYELREREQNSAEREGFSSKDIVYLITPDRFANGDPANDTVPSLHEVVNRADPGGRHGGDIQGIINHLDYIQDMGFTAIWLNPLLENNMETYSYHGYSTTDYYKIDPRFGTNQDYKRLVGALAERNMLLIMDMIANHCGFNHWWTTDLPTADWYNFQDIDEKPYSTHRRVTWADPYVTEIDRKMNSDGWFTRKMPDLNQRNPLLATYLIQNSIWWIEYAGLRGIRQDTWPYPEASFMTEWTQRIMEEYPRFNIVGEEWSSNPAIVSRWQAGSPLAGDYVSYLPSVMDFPLQKALLSSITSEPAPYSDSFNSAYEMLANDFLYGDPYKLVVFLTNHDMPRLYNQVNLDYELFQMALVYLYTVRGTPQFYYGDEILMYNTENPRSHSLIRTDMPGGWPGDTVDAFSGTGLTEQQRNAQSFVRKMTRFRRDTDALHDGVLRHFAPRDEVYIMFRYNDDMKIMSIFNKNPDDKVLNLTYYEEMLGTAKRATNVFSGESQRLHDKSISVPALSGTMWIVE